MGIFRKIKNAWLTYRQHCKEPVRLEFVLTDHCNLNCKGCTHYSPLVPAEYEPLDALEADVAHLSRVAPDIEVVYLIGGETLLYPQLVEAMRVLREGWPDASVKLFTNGLLLPRMSDEFWEAAARYNVVIAITRYPVKFDYDAAEKLCADRGGECEVFGDRSQPSTFFRYALDPEGRQNSRLNHFRCYNRGCISVVGGNVYPCSISACVGHLNRACGTAFTHRPGDFIPVSSVRSSADIRRLRDKPVPFCRYCKSHPRAVVYGPSRRDVAEWVDM